MIHKNRPNVLVILIDDLRFDELGITGHPYAKTPNIDRIGQEGVVYDNAFHTTPLCSPNRASILTGQYASRHGILDNVSREGLSYRLANYNLLLKDDGYTTAHIGKWHMGNSANPRPGYSHWMSFEGHGRLENPTLNINGERIKRSGYITDILNSAALDFVEKNYSKPFALFLAHKAVHPDVLQHADGTLDVSGGGYISAERHRNLYRRSVFPPRSNVMNLEKSIREKRAFVEAFKLRSMRSSREVLRWVRSGTQEEIRLRARMMASVDEGVGDLLGALSKKELLDNTVIIFLSDNGYFFGEHGLGPERRFAYEEAIRSPLLIRYPRCFSSSTRSKELVLAIDIAPTILDLVGINKKAWKHIQGRSLLQLQSSGGPKWRSSFMCEYYGDNAMPWLHGMSYKAVRTHRYKYIHWTQRSMFDRHANELYDLANDPYELRNIFGRTENQRLENRLKNKLRQHICESLGI